MTMKPRKSEGPLFVVLSEFDILFFKAVPTHPQEWLKPLYSYSLIHSRSLIRMGRRREEKEDDDDDDDDDRYYYYYIYFLNYS